MKKTALFSGYDWTIRDISRAWDEIRVVAEARDLDFYEPQIEIISDKEMIEMYTYSLPIGYPHWSFGHAYNRNMDDYCRHPSHIAYEIVVNTDPSICYIMGSNTLAQQLLVLAHAAVGHSNIFKNNVHFKKHTQAKHILNVLASFKSYILDCEQEHGRKEVEQLIDAGHALMYQSIDRSLIDPSLNSSEEVKDSNTRVQSSDHILDQLLPREPVEQDITKRDCDNILSYICANSNYLEPWQKTILNTLQYIATYFYPQIKTKILNEGFATGIEHVLLDDLYEKGLVSSGIIIESIYDESMVKYQRSSFNERAYFVNHVHGEVSGSSIRYDHKDFNPYALGSAVLKDLRRISSDPTDEDRVYFRDLIGVPFMDIWKDACWNYDDSGFIHQFLSPKVSRDYKMAVVFNDSSSDYYVVDHVGHDEDFPALKRCLADMIDRENTPTLVTIVKDDKKERVMKLVYSRHSGIELFPAYGRPCIKYIQKLMNYEAVELEHVNINKPKRG